MTDLPDPDPDPSPLEGLRIREAARALIIDPDDRVLLVRFEFPAGTRWALPGGGREQGETPVETIRRELIEEVGLRGVEVGPHIWTRLHVIAFIDGRWDGQREQIHLVRAPRFEPAPVFTAEELAAEFVFEIRWWTLAEIRASEAVFVPRALGEYLGAILDGHVPNAPIDIDV